jgi:hypothetical protein
MNIRHEICHVTEVHTGIDSTSEQNLNWTNPRRRGVECDKSELPEF